MAAKVSKLEEQFKQDAPREKQKEGGSSSIFSGVAIYVNGYTGMPLPHPHGTCCASSSWLMALSPPPLCRSQRR